MSQPPIASLPACCRSSAESSSYPGQQEQEAEPDVGQQLDAGRLGQAEHMRADQHAAEQEDDHLRNPRTRQDSDNDRGEHGDQRHGHQVIQPLSKVHDSRLA